MIKKVPEGCSDSYGQPALRKQLWAENTTAWCFERSELRALQYVQQKSATLKRYRQGYHMER